jgi:hypothetical protein
MPQKCHVHNCTQPAVAKGLCQTHYKRVQRHGDVEQARADDWGQREKHPAYRSWHNLRRSHRLDMQESWRDDFWAFVKDVPEKPSNSRAQRSDSKKPWTADNFYWKEKRSSSEDRKVYMREWYKQARLANTDYYLDQDLRRTYGITLEWYREQLSKQGNVCAICKQLETTVIRGKVIAMSVDHDHNTGRARGLLCTSCNRGLGLFRDSEDILQAAIQYLKTPVGG